MIFTATGADLAGKVAVADEPAPQANTSPLQDPEYRRKSIGRARWVVRDIIREDPSAMFMNGHADQVLELFDGIHNWRQSPTIENARTITSRLHKVLDVANIDWHSQTAFSAMGKNNETAFPIHSYGPNQRYATPSRAFLCAVRCGLRAVGFEIAEAGFHREAAEIRAAIQMLLKTDRVNRPDIFRADGSNKGKSRSAGTERREETAVINGYHEHRVAMNRARLETALVKSR